MKISSKARRSLQVREHPEIRRLARLIGDKFNPHRIVLFGSCSRGTQTADSDVDLLIIMDSTIRNVKQALEISRAVPHPFPMDIIVYKPGEVERRISGGDTVLEDMLKEGLVLYEARHERVDRESGR